MSITLKTDAKKGTPQKYAKKKIVFPQNSSIQKVYTHLYYEYYNFVKKLAEIFLLNYTHIA